MYSKWAGNFQSMLWMYLWSNWRYCWCIWTRLALLARKVPDTLKISLYVFWAIIDGLTVAYSASPARSEDYNKPNSLKSSECVYTINYLICKYSNKAQKAPYFLLNLLDFRIFIALYQLSESFDMYVERLCESKLRISLLLSCSFLQINVEDQM